MAKKHLVAFAAGIAAITAGAPTSAQNQVPAQTQPQVDPEMETYINGLPHFTTLITDPRFGQNVPDGPQAGVDACREAGRQFMEKQQVTAGLTDCLFAIKDELTFLVQFPMHNDSIDQKYREMMVLAGEATAYIPTVLMPLFMGNPAEMYVIGNYVEDESAPPIWFKSRPEMPDVSVLRVVDIVEFLSKQKIYTINDHMGYQRLPVMSVQPDLADPVSPPQQQKKKQHPRRPDQPPAQRTPSKRRVAPDVG